MAAALRHKQVRPDTQALIQSVLTGNSEPVRVVSKTANGVALMFGNGYTLTYSAVSGDSVVYRADNGHEFKLFPAPAVTEVQPMPEPTPVPVAAAALPAESDPTAPAQYDSPALHLVAPTIPAAVESGKSVPAFLTLTTPSGMFRYRVTVEDSTETELLVRHENGYIRVLRLVSDDHMDCRETDPRVSPDYGYRITLRTPSSEQQVA